ncbi:MAG: hypothetical protein IJ215_02880 [Clostridia bacterium]|nr:hypothetical protein [Clostridia bacterium]
MGIQEELSYLIEVLKSYHIEVTQEFYSDILKNVKGGFKDFAKRMIQDFRTRDFNLNKHEILNLNSTQKRQLNYLNLYRYEYRNNINLRCMYIIENEHKLNENIILLCAFLEDGNKKKGPNSYKENIEKAISIYEKYKLKLVLIKGGNRNGY